MKRYVSGPDGEWIEVGKKPRKERKGPMIWDDLKEYIPVAGPEAEKFIRKARDAKYISGRRQHREYLKRNGLQEVGNEWTEFTRYGGKTADNPTVGWMKHGVGGQWTTPQLERLIRGKRK